MTDSSSPGSGQYNFHRYNGDDTDADAPLWDIPSSNGWASGSITGGTTSVNGSVYYENNASTIANMPVNAAINGFNLIAVQATGPVTADSFNYDRNQSYHSAQNGGQVQAEVIVYDSALTADQVQLVEAYLNDKWGLGASGLPSLVGNNVLPTSTALAVAADSTLDFNGVSQQVASLGNYGGSGGTVTNSAANVPVTLTLGPSGGSATFSGVIDGSSSGAISLVMSGSGTQTLAGSFDGPGSVLVDSGTLILSGTDSYTGGTTVSGGTLEVAAASALPAGQNLAVGAGGTFIFDPTAAAAPLAELAAASPAGSLAAVPEPGTLALLAAGVVAAYGLWRKRKVLSTEFWVLGTKC